MLFQYQCVSLNLLHVQEYSKEALYEDHNYIGTKIKLVVRGVYNPSTQSDSWGSSPTFDNWNSTGLPYVPANARPNAAAANPLGPLPQVLGGPNFGPPGGKPPTRPGVPAAVSDVALRHALMQPRGQLIFSVGGIVNIFSPMQGMPTDVTGGPFPLAVNVVQLWGSRSWLVDYSISTVINECPLYGGNPPALLSETWERFHELDEHYWTKAITRGRAVFRQDALTRMGVEPDNYRGLLGIGIPNNCKRESIKVRVGHPRNVVHYETVDRQVPVGWSQNGITKVNAVQTISLNRSSYVEALKSFSFEKPQNSIVGAWESVAPSNSFVFDVEVWGGQNSTREALEAFALLVIAGREQAIIARLLAMQNQAQGATLQAIQNAVKGLLAQTIGSVRYDVVHDLMDKHIKIHKSYVTGPINQLLGGGFASAAGTSTNLGMTKSDGTVVTINGQVVPLLIANTDIAGMTTGVNIPGPPGDFNMRGSYLGQCVAAALQRSCEVPPAPQLAPNEGMILSPVPPYLTSYQNPYTY